jgi:hypothetical protein
MMTVQLDASTTVEVEMQFLRPGRAAVEIERMFVRGGETLNPVVADEVDVGGELVQVQPGDFITVRVGR